MACGEKLTSYQATTYSVLFHVVNGNTPLRFAPVTSSDMLAGLRFSSNVAKTTPWVDGLPPTHATPSPCVPAATQGDSWSSGEGGESRTLLPIGLPSRSILCPKMRNSPVWLPAPLSSCHTRTNSRPVNASEALREKPRAFVTRTS